MVVFLMYIWIDNKGGAPIYDQIYTQIKNQIISGQLGPDEMLPSIRTSRRILGSASSRRSARTRSLKKRDLFKPWRPRAASSPRKTRRCCATST